MSADGPKDEDLDDWEKALDDWEKNLEQSAPPSRSEEAPKIARPPAAPTPLYRPPTAGAPAPAAKSGLRDARPSDPARTPLWVRPKSQNPARVSDPPPVSQRPPQLHTGFEDEDTKVSRIPVEVLEGIARQEALAGGIQQLFGGGPKEDDSDALLDSLLENPPSRKLLVARAEVEFEEQSLSAAVPLAPLPALPSEPVSQPEPQLLADDVSEAWEIPLAESASWELSESALEIAQSADLPSVFLEDPGTPDPSPFLQAGEAELPDERDGVTHLHETEQLEKFRQRSAWLEEEMRACSDKNARARGLLVCSELSALEGDEARALRLAREARDAIPSHPIASRQARAFAAREGDWREVVSALETESRAAQTPALRHHAAWFAAQIARIALRDRELWSKRVEQSLRAYPEDARAHVEKLAAAIADNEPVPKLRLGESPDLVKLGEIATQLSRSRASADKSPPQTPEEALVRLRAAIRTRDKALALAALDVLMETEEVRDGAEWLSASIAALSPATRPRAKVSLGRLAARRADAHARLALVALALEATEESARAEVLAHVPFLAPEEAATLLALVGSDPAHALKIAEAPGVDPTVREVALAALAAMGSAISPFGASLAGGDASHRLGRLLGARAPSEELATALPAAIEEGCESSVSLGLSLELAQEQEKWGELSTVLMGVQAEDRQRLALALAAGLLRERGGDAEGARESYDRARLLAPDCEPAVRAAGDLSPLESLGSLLTEHESSLGTAGPFALLEAAIRARGSEGYQALLLRAHERMPELPIAGFLGEREARSNGDLELVTQWLAARRKAAKDPVERAHDLVREALLIADRDTIQAGRLLEEASSVRPADIGLRDLYERLAPVPPKDRAEWLSARARELAGVDRARFAQAASAEYERRNELELAAEMAELADRAAASSFTKIPLERVSTVGPYAAQLADRLMADAREAAEPVRRREAYERLSVLDEQGQGDAASVILWHRSILEEEPTFLPSLRALAGSLMGGTRNEELALVLAAIASTLSGKEADAYASVSLRLQGGASPTFRDRLEIAFHQNPPSLWSVRDMEALANSSGDLQTSARTAELLAERTRRPLEIATLKLRQAETKARLGHKKVARELLVEIMQLEPAHLVAQRLLAETCEVMEDFPAAAQAYAAVAELSNLAGPRIAAFHRAGVLYADKLLDRARARRCFEAAGDIDLSYLDLFSRLQGIYVALGDRDAIAELLERRLSQTRNPTERVELEVIRGRTLAEIGDAVAAKRALAAALESSPDHTDALEAFADLCAREGDDSGAEQALIRLARLVPEVDRQASIYMRLGHLYDKQKPNPERAELAYKEVLRRSPHNIPAQERLVSIYRRSRDAAKALEVQQSLVKSAADQAVRRRRTVEFADIYEEVGGDIKRAQAILEAARKEFPHDAEVLVALVSFYRRHQMQSLASNALERAGSDARRALSTGRFDLQMFRTLASVAGLSDDQRRRSVAEATVAALGGTRTDLPGAGLTAAANDLEHSLAPELLSAPLRELLACSGDLLDAAHPLDLRGLSATPLSESHFSLRSEILDIAQTLGITDVQVWTSPSLGPVCIPASSVPALVVLGEPLVHSTEGVARRFAILRALKLIAAKSSALARASPVELGPLVSGYLRVFAPNWQPVGIDLGKVREPQTRMARALPDRADPRCAPLALEVVATIGNRIPTLGEAVRCWANRVALVSEGDPFSALMAIAWSSGLSAGPPAEGAGRISWAARNPEARDLMIFSVGDTYAEARARAAASL